MMPHSVQITAAASALQLLTAGSATAAKIELEVPDFLVENNPVDIVLQSPVFAVAAAVLGLILFPKLIRVRRSRVSHVCMLGMDSCLNSKSIFAWHNKMLAGHLNALPAEQATRSVKMQYFAALFFPYVTVKNVVELR